MRKYKSVIGIIAVFSMLGAMVFGNNGVLDCWKGTQVYYAADVSQGAVGVNEEAVVLTGTAAKLASIQDPIVEASTGAVTFSYLYMGQYPQSEVTGEELTDAIVKAEYVSGEAVVGKFQYRRLETEEGYRYFKYEPIKWRVLELENNIAELRTDAIIDCQPYNNYELEIKSDSKWMWTSIRYWLNSYAPYKDGFYDAAFTECEKNSILEEYYTEYHYTEKYEMSDKVHLRGASYAHWNKEAYIARDTEYATAVYGKGHACNQWTVFANYDLIYFCEYIDENGILHEDGLFGVPVEPDASDSKEEFYYMNSAETPCGIRPVININISNTDVWMTEEEMRNKMEESVEPPIVSKEPVTEPPVTPSDEPIITSSPIVITTPDISLTPIDTPTPVPSELPTIQPSDKPDEKYEDGDVDMNGKVTLSDAQTVLKIALKIETADRNKIVLADVDKDGQITLADAQQILKKALRIIV